MRPFDGTVRLRRFTRLLVHSLILIPAFFVIAQLVFHLFSFFEEYVLQPIHHKVVDPLLWDVLWPFLTGTYFYIPALPLFLWLALLAFCVACEFHRIGWKATGSGIRHSLKDAYSISFAAVKFLVHTVPLKAAMFTGTAVKQSPQGVKQIVDDAEEKDH